MKRGIPVLSVLALGVFFLSQLADAKPQYQQWMKAKYPKTNYNCTVCHVSTGSIQLNAYGKDFKTAGRTRAAFTKIEKKDSDKDKFTNIAEIKARTNPGNAGSKPKK